MMDKPINQLGVTLLLIIIMVIVAWATNIVINYYESDEWFERRNKHRMYDPVEDPNNEDMYIIEQ